jgi:hypothetical protein
MGCGDFPEAEPLPLAEMIPEAFGIIRPISAASVGCRFSSMALSFFMMLITRASIPEGMSSTK